MTATKEAGLEELIHQLVDIEKDNNAVVDSILVVTDRRNLDRQIRDTIKAFTSVLNTIAPAETSSDLREAIEAGKKIIITTIHKFPYIFADMGTAHKGRRFVIIIDEAHSSQSGNMSAKMNAVLSTIVFSDDDEREDIVNKLIESRKLLPNASYFVFTATPKNKTLELFGTPYAEDGKTKHRPFHNYSLKQAIEEGFIETWKTTATGGGFPSFNKIIDGRYLESLLLPAYIHFLPTLFFGMTISNVPRQPRPFLFAFRLPPPRFQPAVTLAALRTRPHRLIAFGN